MLEALTDGERCVCELQALVGSDMSTVSKHLALMRGAGLVDDRRQGLQVYSRLRAPCVMGFLECVDAVREQPLPVRLGALPAGQALTPPSRRLRRSPLRHRPGA